MSIRRRFVRDNNSFRRRMVRDMEMRQKNGGGAAEYLIKTAERDGEAKVYFPMTETIVSLVLLDYDPTDDQTYFEIREVYADEDYEVFYDDTFSENEVRRRYKSVKMYGQFEPVK